MQRANPPSYTCGSRSEASPIARAVSVAVCGLWCSNNHINDRSARTFRSWSSTWLVSMHRSAMPPTLTLASRKRADVYCDCQT